MIQPGAPLANSSGVVPLVAGQMPVVVVLLQSSWRIPKSTENNDGDASSGQRKSDSWCWSKKKKKQHTAKLRGSALGGGGLLVSFLCTLALPPPLNPSGLP